MESVKYVLNNRFLETAVDLGLLRGLETGIVGRMEKGEEHPLGREEGVQKAERRAGVENGAV